MCFVDCTLKRRSKNTLIHHQNKCHWRI